MRSFMFYKLNLKSKKPLWVIPFLFTFANALCGFLSVIKTLDENYFLSACFIILAAVMDLADGRLARMIGSTSVLGMELDSLCDAISFCFAPAILIYSWNLYQLNSAGLVVLGIYLCTGLFRLARFNSNPSPSLKYFTGLPTTIAAFLLANMVLYEDWITHSLFKSMLKPDRTAFLVTIIALLMISTIKFPSIKRLQLPFVAKVLIIAPLAFTGYFLIQGYPLPLFFILFYILISFLMTIFKGILRLPWLAR